ncbi:hypothetical protein [Priestia taiwanensis]|uniref:Uncharacterized protein n=1 Tax=Priestia taiwanensis TaxID=1347902 RepID=A0A917AQE7_9BACI|nr:hypothetical protein [Priestia taiwanensis]MBM7363035.1 TM2 domain-containing membrane protein YozV [Priestia taiwanensis]GGE67077.1 hypothetical protein GCM10007140_16560 [Priestia taiwanensis]
MKDKVHLLKWISMGLEAFLGIPVIGGSIVLSLIWTPLLFMLVLHIVIVILCRQEKLPNGANTIGIITSSIAWIPIVGMIMHLLTAICIFLEIRNNRKSHAS